MIVKASRYIFPEDHELLETCNHTWNKVSTSTENLVAIVVNNLIANTSIIKNF